MKFVFPIVCALILALTTRADSFLDKIGTIAKGTNQPFTLADGLSQDQMVGGLKEALANGVQHAVSSLGQSGGFLTNLNVKIPLPEKLNTVEKALRSMHQEKMADDFVVTMNRAA